MTYRILSLDGGGSWALLQAMALKEIYKDRPQGNKCKTILTDFDLIIANSGGSLMLAAMIEKDTIDEVIFLFLDEQIRKSIFSDLGFWKRSWTEKLVSMINFGPKYSTVKKIEGIRRALPVYGTEAFDNIASKLGIDTKFMIMGFDYDRQRAVYFRSYQSSNSSSSDNSVQLSQAVHASSNAPLMYFDEPALFSYQGYQRRFWDGAVGGNNNPCLVGVIEAMAQGIKHENIELRSIGTGNVSLPLRGQTLYNKYQFPYLGQNPDSRNLKTDIKKMAGSILSEPPDVATYVSHIILGGLPAGGSKPRVVRLNPLIQPYLDNNKQWIVPPDFKTEFFEKLIGLDMDAVEQDDVNYISYLGAMWLADKVHNQPIRMSMDDFTCQIGHKVFSEGKKDW